MTRFLDAVARIVTRTPKMALTGLLVLTVIFGAGISLLQVDTGVESFAPSDGRAEALNRIEERFGTTASVQALIDDGPGGNVLRPEVLRGVEQLVEDIEHHPDVAAVLAAEEIGQPAVISFALPFSAAGEALGEDLTEVDEAVFASLASTVISEGGEQVGGLFSQDLRAEPARARAGLLVVNLDASVDSQARDAGILAIEDLVRDADIEGTRRSTLSMLAIEEGIESSLQRDLPVLLSVSLFLVIGILALLFRSVVDVIVGLVGLLASIIWMTGIAAVLGPGGLDLIGPFSQVAIAVPVLLVGLGIDYSVHLTTRYREQRRRGDDAVASSRTALRTVGVALVLATIASVAGFLANLVTPLPPIRDFGIFAAVGITSAFIILSVAVPAARTLVDQRRDRKRSEGTAPDLGDQPGSDVVRTDADQTAAPSWTVRSWQALSALAVRAPGLVIVGTFLALALAAFAASGLSTEFDERDFLPDGEPVLDTIDRLDELFGGDVGERTYLLVDGDPTDTELLGAIAAVEGDLAKIDDVHTIEGRTDRRSALELRERIEELGQQVRTSLHDELVTFNDPEAAAAEVELPEPLDVDAFLGELGGEELDPDLEQALSARLPAGRPPLAALLSALDPDELEEQIRGELARGFREDIPATIDPAVLTELVELEPEQLSVSRLRAAGYPLDELHEEDRRVLHHLEALESAGDLTATDGETLLAHLDVLQQIAPDDVAGLVDSEGLLISVATRANQDRASQLAGELVRATAPIEQAGGTITVVSQPLVTAEIIDELSASQLIAIAISLAAAALLLAIASWGTSRTIGLGLISIVPSVVALVMILGSMRLLGLSLNALTATVASISVGIGVPYGIHLTNRFSEGMTTGRRADDAAEDALVNTGPALFGSAATTGLAFAVLMLSGSTPIQQFGVVSTLMIGFALAACLLVQPAILVLWGRRRAITGGHRPQRETTLAGSK